MNMTQTVIGNPDLDFLFDDTSFKARQKGKAHEELSKLYNSIKMSIPNSGDIVSAEYTGISANQYVLSVTGYKDDIRIESRASEAKYLKNVNIGDFIDVLVIDVNNDDFFIKGSIAELYESRAHQNLKSLEEGASVTAHIKSLNPAGYDVEILHGGVTLPAFMPNTIAGINKLYDPTSIVGQTFEVMIESYSEQEGTYIVSRRKYLQSLIPDAVKSLEYNVAYDGHVTGTTPFGVFVEFNECLTGMIHKANINPDWSDRISEIKPGFEITFYIKEIIKDRHIPKLILTQVLRESLWDNIKNGQIIEGKVKDIKPFGTLVNLDEETVGLIHSSEMDKLGKIKFEPEQNLKVRVLSVDRTARKIFLTVA
jgi:4-hydroxy-3-methylbut-2-enyl diphosphate reductase